MIVPLNRHFCILLKCYSTNPIKLLDPCETFYKVQIVEVDQFATLPDYH